MSRPYTIAGLAAAAGVHFETVRYCQRLKLLPEPAKPPGGIRRCIEADADRCHATRELELRLLDTGIRELRGLRKNLARLVAACDTNTHDDTCPVLERLDPHRGPPKPPRARAVR
jgi:DNA-binding transcriptional MerR regulator